MELALVEAAGEGGQTWPVRRRAMAPVAFVGRGRTEPGGVSKMRQATWSKYVMARQIKLWRLLKYRDGLGIACVNYHFMHECGKAGQRRTLQI
jgi:hypothetical protein